MACTFALKLMGCLHGQPIQLLSRSDLTCHHVLHLGTDYIQEITKRAVQQLASKCTVADARRLTAIVPSHYGLTQTSMHELLRP